MLPDKKYFKDYCKEKNIPWREKDVLREYLQTQVLKVLFSSEFGDKVSFLGGTSLRFVHNINRFSENLDFDLIEKGDFSIERMAKGLAGKIELLGFGLDIKTKTAQNIQIIYLKFRNVLQEFGFRVNKDEKFLIKFEIDFAPYSSIEFETKFTDKFNERFPVVINTLPTLFAQKIIALKFRPYQKGRDFYDLVWFLAQKIEPNWGVLKEKGLAVGNKSELKRELEKIIAHSDLEQAKKDVAPFLFSPAEAEWILLLPKMVEGIKRLS